MPRTNAALVAELLGAEYDRARSLAGFIATANALVSRVASCAADGDYALSVSERELLERWLAAHFYQASDPGYTSKNTEKAGGSFTGQFGKGLEGTRYGQAALDLDPSGCLATITAGRRAGMFWGGTAESDQLSYDERN